jgi:hypothetical protein
MNCAIHPLSQKKRERELEGIEDEKRGAPTEPAHLYSRQIGIFICASGLARAEFGS